MQTTTLPFTSTEAAHASLVVSSLEEALDFWVNVLGFRLLSREWHSSFAESDVGVEEVGDVSAAVVEGAGQVLELREHHAPREGQAWNPQPRVAREFRVAFSAGDLEAALLRVACSRWRIVGAIQATGDGDRPGGVFTYLRGPDGITIELTEQSGELHADGRVDESNVRMSMCGT